MALISNWAERDPEAITENVKEREVRVATYVQLTNGNWHTGQYLVTTESITKVWEGLTYGAAVAGQAEFTANGESPRVREDNRIVGAYSLEVTTATKTITAL